jgi:hypothetical protein
MQAYLQEKKSRDTAKSGSILLISLLICFTAALVCGSYVAYTMNSAFQTRLTIDHRKARAAADAVLEYGTVQLASLMANQPMYPCQVSYLQNLVNTITFTNSIDGYVISRPNGQPAFKITVDSDVLTGVITNGSACRGADGDYQFFTITAGARNPKSGVTAVLQKKVQLLGVYLIRFGVFYENDLEIIPGATMSFSAGPVHCNYDMYLGGTLSLNDRVTSHGNIYARRKNDTNTLSSTVTIKNAAGANMNMKMGSIYVDSDYTLWMGTALSRWDGRVLSRAHGVPELRPPINVTDVPYTIIQRPMTTNSTLAASKPYYVLTNSIMEDTEAERIVNRACLRLLISNTTVYAWDQHDNLISTNACFTNVVLAATTTNLLNKYPGFAKTNSDSYLITTNTKGFFNLGPSTARFGTNSITYTNTFYDAREKTNVTPIDIYVDRLASVLTNLMYDVNSDGAGGVTTTNTPWRTNVVFVTFAANQVFNKGLPAVRLRNAKLINLSRGLTVISDKPIYIEGNYNTTNRFSTNNLPCMVGGDAVTMLSTNWQDAKSYSNACSIRPAGDTTYNTVIMTGNTNTKKGNSSTGKYNGGLENVLRFLEDWSTPNEKVTYNGSIIDLWNSRIATNAWVTPDTSSYYTAPTRVWGYDTILRHAAPPGMTRVYGMEELEWKVITWQQAGW